MKRRETTTVNVGGVLIGSGHPIVIQSMNNTDTRDAKATIAQIKELAAAGCEITRVAVPDTQAADALKDICRQSPIPVVADIHFDYRLALAAINNGAAKIRINPGNIGSTEKVKAVAEAARKAKIPIRVGVNSGSLQKDLLAKYGQVTAEALAESALSAIKQLEQVEFFDLVVSLKASSPLLTIEAYKILATRVSYPLHIGVTEAGTLREGIIRSSVGLGALLADGIGDTLRVSLTADPVEEVKAAWSILKSLDLRRKGPVFVSCPTCGRTQVDLVRIANQVETRLAKMPYQLHIAVMGCIVNGPGEARGADYGIAGGHGRFSVFAKGKTLNSVTEENAVEALVNLIKTEYGDWE